MNGKYGLRTMYGKVLFDIKKQDDDFEVSGKVVEMNLPLIVESVVVRDNELTLKISVSLVPGLSIFTLTYNEAADSYTVDGDMAMVGKIEGIAIKED